MSSMPPVLYLFALSGNLATLLPDRMLMGAGAMFTAAALAVSLVAPALRGRTSVTA